MIKIFLTIVFIFFYSTNMSFTSESPCSQFNKWTENYKYQKCINKLRKDGKLPQGKTENFFSNLNKKYKSLREKVPKTGDELWKK